MSQQLASDAVTDPAAAPAGAPHTHSTQAEVIGNKQATYPDLPQTLHRAALWLATLLLCFLLA